MGDRRDLEDAVAALLQVGADQVGEVLAVRHVDLVEDDHPGTVVETAVLGELLLDGVEVGDRVAVRLQGRGVQNVDEHLAALDVPQELQTQALALAGAGDQTGDVRDGVDGRTGGHHTEVGHQGGEGVVRDFRLGGREDRDQGGLSGARVADQGHVRDGLQLEDDVAGLAGLAQQREAGGLATGRGQCGVAEATAAALAGDEGGALADEVGQHLAVAVEDHGAVGDRQHQVLAVLAGTVVARARRTIGGLAMRVVVVFEERGDGLVDDQDHIAAAAAVAAVGAAQRFELLPHHGGHAVASVTRGDMQLDAVHEGGHGWGASR